MGRRRRSARSSCAVRCAARRFFRPRGECLERRLALAGLFTEDFSSDANPSNPGFDTALDGFVIENDLPPPGLEGASTGRGGWYYLQQGNAGDPGWGLYADGHILVILGTNFFVPQVTFRYPAAGQPGGPDVGEEVSGVGLSVQGFGQVQFAGQFGTKVVNFSDFNTWQRIVADKGDVLPGGGELGAIQAVRVYSTEYVAVDIVSMQVAEATTNHPPIATPDTIVVDRQFGQSEIFNPIENDFDPDNDFIAIFKESQQGAQHGTVTEVYDQFDNFRGYSYRASPEALEDPNVREDSFTYVIHDTFGATSQGTVRLLLNFAPAGTQDVYTAAHGSALPVIVAAADGVLANDRDSDGDPLTARLANLAPLHGAVSLQSDGSFIYSSSEPDGLVLPDRFWYFLNDGIQDSELIRVDIVVPNRPPEVFERTSRFTWDTPEPLQGRAYYEDRDGDLVTAILATPPQHGTVELSLDRDQFGEDFVHWSYQPDARYGDPLVGDEARPDDSFGIQVRDRSSESNIATQRILANSAPIADDDTLLIRVNPANLPPLGQFRFAAPSVLENDIDPDGDPVYASHIVRQPNYGTVQFDFADGTLTYQSSGLVEGPDSFTYVATDLRGRSNTATVTLNVHFDSWIQDDHYQVPHGVVGGPPGGLAFPPQFGLFANDFDDQGQPAQIGFNATVTLEGPNPNTDRALLDEFTDVASVRTFHGQVWVHRDGSLLYVPDPGYVGSDSFKYKWTWISQVREGAVGNVQIDVGNRPPVAEAGPSYTIFEGQSIVLDATASFDPDGDPLEIEWSATGDRRWPGPTPLVQWSEVKGLGNSFSESADIGLQLTVSDGYETAGSRTTLRIRGDGVNESQEDAAPNGGDGNADGVLDRLQGNVTSFGYPFQPKGTLFSPAGTYLVGVDPLVILPPRTIPGTPLLNLAFTLAGLTPGQATVVSLTSDAPFVANSYAKYGPRPDDPGTPADESLPQWYEFLYDGTTGARFYDANGLEIAPHGSTPIARIDLHFVDGLRGDSDSTANGQITDPGGPAMVPQAPRVAGLQINDGAAQRSMITSLSVAFDSLVTIQPGAFDLRLIGQRKPVDLKVVLNEIDGNTVAQLTFKTGRDVSHGSLRDGAYRLTIRADKVRDASGDQLDGNGDGNGGGDFVAEFFRLFGDADGDGDLDPLDKGILQSAYGNRSANAGYLWYLDANANGRIWVEDLALFLLGYCRSSRRR